LLSHPKCGASWEGYVIEETIKATEPDEIYYWATHSGAEIDLVLIKNGRMLGVECKRMDAPRITPSMRITREELNLEQIAVVYPGKNRYAMGDGVAAVPLNAVAEGMKGLFPKKK
jgi:predicted AAA+ superfamily ATPase